MPIGVHTVQGEGAVCLITIAKVFRNIYKASLFSWFFLTTNIRRIGIQWIAVWLWRTSSAPVSPGFPCFECNIKLTSRLPVANRVLIPRNSHGIASVCERTALKIFNVPHCRERRTLLHVMTLSATWWSRRCCHEWKMTVSDKNVRLLEKKNERKGKRRVKNRGL